MKIIRKNKKIFHDYTIIKTFSAGMVLKGTDIKPIKEGKIEIERSYIRFLHDQLFIVNSRITNSEEISNVSNKRRLLLNRKEIDEIGKYINVLRLTAVPIEVVLDHGLIKLRLAIVKGIRKYDKREKEKERDVKKALMKLKRRNI